MNDAQPTVPYGYCHCGCGEKAPRSRDTITSRGIAKGDPLPFRLGHHAFPRTPPVNPSGLCMCGCGNPAPIAKRTTDGYIRGEHKRFINHHGRRIAIRWLSEDRGYATPCHIWRLSTDDAGYGRNGAHTRAHKQAWLDARGPVPLGLFVCHHCDQPDCVNVEHLFLGTPLDNMEDAARKGRKAIKLTAADVAAIRAAVAAGRTQTAVAPEFGITQCMVSAIVRRKAWKHVP